MKTKLIAISLFLALFGLNSCQKEYMGPIDETGAPLQIRGGEDGSGNTTDGGTDGITDGGHDSDYDNSSKGKRKAAVTPQ